MPKNLTAKTTDLVNTIGKNHETSRGLKRKYNEKYFQSHNDMYYGSKILFYKTKLLSMGGQSL